jgi:hypothetical protein
MRPATSPLCARLAVFWHRHHVGAYIFDCAKHAAVFDLQWSSEFGSEIRGGCGNRAGHGKRDVIRQNDNDPAKRFPFGNNRWSSVRSV